MSSHLVNNFACEPPDSSPDIYAYIPDYLVSQAPPLGYRGSGGGENGMGGGGCTTLQEPTVQ